MSTQNLIYGINKQTLRYRYAQQNNILGDTRNLGTWISIKCVIIISGIYKWIPTKINIKI